MKLVLFCLFALRPSLFAAALSSEASAKDEKPNVVFILADDLGYSDLGCYGASRSFTTPPAAGPLAGL
jgi:hypothetical protein